MSETMKDVRVMIGMSTEQVNGAGSPDNSTCKTIDAFVKATMVTDYTWYPAHGCYEGKAEDSVVIDVCYVTEEEADHICRMLPYVARALDQESIAVSVTDNHSALVFAAEVSEGQIA